VTAATFPRRLAETHLATIRLVAHWRWVALVAFGSWLLLVGSHHEPWLDEAQAWLLARDNDLWTLLAERVRYEGTPGLWHLILWLAIRGGLPFSHIFLISAGFSLSGAAVILWRAPFPTALRLAILASYFFGYQFSVVARSYSVDLLLVPLAAAFFSTRTGRPLRYALVIGLIANTNAHGFLAAGVLGLEFAWQLWRQKQWLQRGSFSALLLAGGLGLFALWSAWQPADNGYLHSDMRSGPIASFVLYLCNAFIDRVSLWSSTPPSVGDISLGFLLSLFLQIPVVALIMSGTNRLMALTLFGLLLAFSVIVYSSPWHAGLLFLFWLFVIWVEWDNPVSPSLRRRVMAAVAIICLLQAGQTVRAGLWDRSNVYSPGEAVAQMLETYREQYPQAHIAAFGFKAFEVQPWLQNNLFDNYHHAAPKPAYISWLREERWSPRVNASLWQQLLATRPDLILASSIDLGGRPYDLIPQACRAGYRIYQRFPASMTWRGIVMEDQTLIMFERGTSADCHA